MKSFGVEDPVKEPGRGGHCFRRNRETHVGQLVFPSQVHSQLCFCVFHTFAPELRNRRLPAAFTVPLCCGTGWAPSFRRPRHNSPQDTSDYAALWSQMKKQQDDHVERSCCLCHMFCTSRMLPTAWRAEHAVFCFYVLTKLRSFSVCTNMLEIFYQSPEVRAVFSAFVPEVPAGSRLERFNHWSVSQWGSGLDTLLSIVENPSWRTHLGEPIVENPPEERCRRWCCSLCRWTLLSGQTPHTFLDHPSCCCLFRFTLYIFLLMPLSLPLFLSCTVSVHATSSAQFSMSLIFITAIHKILHYCVISLSLYY